MKKLSEKVAKWLGDGVEAWKVDRVAFWWLISHEGKSITVKVGKDEMDMSLKSDDGRPVWYESGPIDKAKAKSLLGFDPECAGVTGYKLTICENVNVQRMKGGNYYGGFPVDPSKVKLVKRKE